MGVLEPRQKMEKDLLVVLARGADPTSLNDEFALVRAASDRVLILSVPDWISEIEVASRPGVEFATSLGVAVESFDLTDSEARFVASWTQQLHDRLQPRTDGVKRQRTPGRRTSDLTNADSS
ncbi:MAG: hypothetical protein HKN07_12400 [Acidimicrobiia bacterium]|nr:hypothetical protein [Acidimicrobiia bacterium]